MGKKIWNWVSSNRIHFIVWILFITYDLIFAGLMNNLFPHPLIDSLHFLVNICFFYFHSHITLPWALKSRQRAVYLLLPAIFLQLTIYTLWHFYTDKFLIAIDVIHLKKVYVLSLQVVTRNLYRGMYFMGFSTGYYYLKVYFEQKKKTNELEKDKLYTIIEKQEVEQELVVAENAFLKAQINPHFLFNTLDFIYHKVNVHSAIAGEAVIKLSHMMRFAIDSDEIGNNVRLADEIEQVENLLYLYQIRKAGDLNVHFEYSNEVRQLYLIPLVVLTLVENIFKHGDISNPEEIAYISIGIVEDNLLIQTVNLISNSHHKHSTHSGLNNIKKRLGYAYGEEFSFQFQVIDNHFKVAITIPTALLKVPI